MKRWLSIVLTISLLFSLLAIGDFSFAMGYNMGDFNRDGVLNTTDVRDVLKKIVGGQTFTAEERKIADMDGSGTVDTADVRVILEHIINGTATDPIPDDVTVVDLLAPTVEDWYNPTETINGNVVALNETALSTGGYRFTNVGGSWPYAAYVYESKILVPKSAIIEYDITVSSDSASINLYLGGSIPVVDDGASPSMLKLNSLITDKLDSGSGDILKGSYKGSVSLSAVNVSDTVLVDGLIWLSGIKIYAVGATDSSVTIRKLTVTGYTQDVTFPDSTDAYSAVRSRMVYPEEMIDFPDLTAMKFYENGILTNSSSYTYTKDYKKIYQSNLKQRAVNYPDGYLIDLPYGFQPDYRLSELRSQFYTEHEVLTVSKEEESPYGNTEAGWETYLTEWVNLYLTSDTYLEKNNISRMREERISETMVDGHTVITYDFCVEDSSGNVEMPYYSIAIIRKFYVYDTFYLMVLKSAVPTTQLADTIVSSFTPIDVYGSAHNSQQQYSKIVPSFWSDETKAYYEKLCSQTTTDFGFFTHSMLSSNDGLYAKNDALIQSNYDRLSTALNYDYKIMPTYTHLKWYNMYNDFPSEMAEKYAGGNGFNGKPVLQFTYQFTINNNNNPEGITPMFDIMRGVHDAQFRELAQDIKAYGKPILFRLNNEMNTDWTSYAGIMTLLDPDVFIITWQRLYNIFIEEGVDNCIWIFNPFDDTYPYSSWSEDLCYMPGPEYVQILGITGYVEGNSSSMDSFNTVYTNIYNKSSKNFANYPWVISEFGCGAGGEKKYNYDTDTYEDTVLGRNGYYQAQWVRSMFSYLNYKSYYPFCANIKGAVWFSCNDYAAINGTNYITNFFSLDDSLTYTLSAFKSGLAYN